MSTHHDRSQGLRLERIRASARYADGSFHNLHPVSPGLKKGTVAPTLKEYLCGGQRRTPPGPLPSMSPLARWAQPVETGLRATWLGHSTVLVEIDGARVLTDPVWGERVSPVSFAGPKRFQPVPVSLDALPALDAVIISHDHFDHLDRPTVVELARRGVAFFTSLGIGAHLESWSIPASLITELDWWESAAIPGTDLTITAAPSQHFSGRSLGGRNATLWSSMVVRGPRHSLFFSGDTGLTPEYEEIRRRLGPFDLVMLEVGAFHPAWGDIHLGPENALKALTLLGGGSFLPVHWGTFNLALHAWDDPAETLLQLAPSVGVHLLLPRLGEAIEPSRAERPTPWWRAAAGEIVAAEEPTPTDDAATEGAPDAPVPWPMD
jgi:L-ascorbate metabolism protein UlaG (beta-lactamase superfamily)